MPEFSNEELNKMLDQAIANSLKKKYHGSDDNILTLPSSDQ